MCGYRSINCCIRQFIQLSEVSYMSEKKKKFQWQQIVFFVFMVAVGAFCGVLMARYIDSISSADTSNMQDLLNLGLIFISLYIGIFLQLVIHEAGHLVFGKLTGYEFSSFRIGNMMWLKDNGKLVRKKLSVAGTGGQCLMVPPEMKDGKIPVVLYNLGGSILNIIAGVVFLILYLVLRSVPVLPMCFLMISIMGFALALTNGIPMRLGTVDNDGYNALSLGKNSEALRSFWVQMKVNELISKGARVKDMPEEWFTVPSDENMKNSMCAAIGVFACSRLMDEHRFEEADALMERLLALDSGIVGLHRSLMICDRMYCELISENRGDVVNGYRTKAQLKFMKSMKNFPSVIRTEYVFALIGEKNADKAEKLKNDFEKCAKTYPYKSDIECERELIEIAENKL